MSGTKGTQDGPRVHHTPAPAHSCLTCTYMQSGPFSTTTPAICVGWMGMCGSLGATDLGSSSFISTSSCWLRGMVGSGKGVAYV